MIDLRYYTRCGTGYDGAGAPVCGHHMHTDRYMHIGERNGFCEMRCQSRGPNRERWRGLEAEGSEGEV